MSWGAACLKIAFAFKGFNFFLHSGTPPLNFFVFFLRRRLLFLNCLLSSRAPMIHSCLVYFAQRPKNGDVAAYKPLPLVKAAMWRSPERQRSTIFLLCAVNWRPTIFLLLPAASPCSNQSSVPF